MAITNFVKRIQDVMRNDAGVNPGLVHEQRVVEIQKNLEKVLDKAKSYDLSKDEIRDLFEILMEE